jgi:hypothetical protein
MGRDALRHDDGGGRGHQLPCAALTQTSRSALKTTAGCDEDIDPEP